MATLTEQYEHSDGICLSELMAALSVATDLAMGQPLEYALHACVVAMRLADALGRENADIAMAAAREEDGQIRTQPVFCLLRAELLESLVAFTHEGGRKIDRWTALNKTVTVPFDQPNDDPRAFFNANTLAELHSLETR